jgi:hypothetical protein
VDTELDNETSGNNDEHENDNEEYNNNTNQPFITDDDEQPTLTWKPRKLTQKE